MEREPICALPIDRRPRVDEVELQRDVIPRRGVVRLKLIRPSRIEDIEHVDPIEPHLVDFKSVHQFIPGR